MARLSCALFLGMLACATAVQNNELRFHVSIPKEIAAQAAQRAAGNASAPAPVLMLHGLEFGVNEGFKIQVLAEPQLGAAPVLLGVTALVGHPQRAPQSPQRKINLPVALNEAAAQLLVYRSELTIILHFDHLDPDRPPVRIDSVFFSNPAKE